MNNGSPLREDFYYYLNLYLSHHSYLSLYEPSSADVNVFASIDKKHLVPSLPHLNRWYNHISTYSAAEQQSFPKFLKDKMKYLEDFLLDQQVIKK